MWGETPETPLFRCARLSARLGLMQNSNPIPSNPTLFHREEDAIRRDDPFQKVSEAKRSEAKRALMKTRNIYESLPSKLTLFHSIYFAPSSLGADSESSPQTVQEAAEKNHKCQLRRPLQFIPRRPQDAQVRGADCWVRSHQADQAGVELENSKSAGEGRAKERPIDQC